MADKKKETKKTEEQIVKDGVHSMTNKHGYIYPKDPEVLKQLDYFKGLKLGFMMHWSPATQLGTMESWPLSDGDREWSKREIDWADNETFKQQYWDAPKTFNPVKFDPEAWAKLARQCGFKYFLFTTKHHDGFCMYDSAYSDYKITNPKCPFSKDSRADIYGELTKAFRAEGLAVSTYFSKPDWHHPDFWCKDFGKPTSRNANYDPTEHPEHWERFVEFVHNQLTELCTNYGRIDTLWLDGGWVRPSVNHQDIRLSEVVEKIRKTTQPHLLVVDRTVQGENENILTPEQSIPPEPIEVPWESCVTLGRSFSFHYDDVYKSLDEVVHMFIEIISKGGSLALNVTPQPDGALPHEAEHLLRRFGRWVRQNEKAIYNSEISPCRPNQRIRYTRVGDKDYAFYLYVPYPVMPKRIFLNVPEGSEVKEVRHVREDVPLSFKQNGQEVTVDTSEHDMLYAESADCFEISYK